LNNGGGATREEFPELSSGGLKLNQQPFSITPLKQARARMVERLFDETTTLSWMLLLCPEKNRPGHAEFPGPKTNQRPKGDINLRTRRSQNQESKSDKRKTQL
jgi:hypothetical protein